MERNFCVNFGDRKDSIIIHTFYLHVGSRTLIQLY